MHVEGNVAAGSNLNGSRTLTPDNPQTVACSVGKHVMRMNSDDFGQRELAGRCENGAGTRSLPRRT